MHSRVLCPAYLPRPVQANFDRAMKQYVSSRSRKINETFVYSRAVARTPNQRSNYYSRNNPDFSMTMTPEMRHVSRIRASNDKKFRDKLREASRLRDGSETSPLAHDVMSADLHLSNKGYNDGGRFSNAHKKGLRKAVSRNGQFTQ